MLAAVAFVTLAQDPHPLTPAEMGARALEVIRRDYYLPQSKLYAERPDRSQPAFNWGVGVMLSALNAAARHSDAYKPQLREFANSCRIYWNQGGYDVLPSPKKLDRYYDDNAWMALALVETYEVLKDSKFLTWADEALKFALSGEAKDGGIYWRETDRASRNTCSCAPTAAACLAIAKHTENQELRKRAEGIYQWTMQHLQDPKDGLFWDSVENDGKTNKTKWTYNSALMIRVMRGFKSTSLNRTCASAKKRWLQDGKLRDPGRFAHLLLEALIEVDGARPEYEQVVRAVWDARSQNGRLPSHWSDLKTDPNAELLDQAAFVRACFVLANRSRSTRVSRE